MTRIKKRAGFSGVFGSGAGEDCVCVGGVTAESSGISVIIAL